MYNYLEELKNRETFIRQLNQLKQLLQTHQLTKDLLNHQEIADYMLIHKIRNVDTYIQLCEKTGKCLGQVQNKQPIDDFNLQLIRFQLIKHKQQQKQNRKKPIQQKISTPSTEVESIVNNKKQRDPNKTQQVIQQIRAKQTPQDLVKIEEYFHNKKQQKLRQIEGWIVVDQSKLKIPIKQSIIDSCIQQFKSLVKQIVKDFSQQ